MRNPSTRDLNRLLRPLQDFLTLEAAGGFVLLAATIVALIIANSPLAGSYNNLLQLPLAIKLGDIGLSKPLLLWINDGLMSVFFFLVGLELKRELLEGHLSSMRRASLPAFAAVGGMLGPAAIYALLNRGDYVAMRGWAIPTATDIAFTLGVLALLGNRVPPALKALLLSIAIFDDLGAIVVIAMFYTSQLLTLALAAAALVAVALFVLHRMKVTRSFPYFLLGVLLWAAILKSGVHATLAGVVLAMFIPLRVPVGIDESPLHRLEHALHPWVAFGVLPIFAFANAGVSLAGLSTRDLSQAVPLGIMLGLFFGKQVGIFALCWLPVKLRIALLPPGVSWSQIYGGAILCGIGFTMSLFIASLAFGENGGMHRGLERLAILIASLVSGLIGYLYLRLILPRTLDIGRTK